MESVERIKGKTFEDFAIEFVKQNGNYTADERLDGLMEYIPLVIENFQDCTSEEEFRMLAKKQDQTLATIQLPHPETGWKLYKPITLNAKDYKAFYYQTLVFCLVQYLLFHRGAQYAIYDDNKQVGTFAITDEQLPHLLGLESRFISSKGCSLLESIIPDFNSYSVFGKIFSLVQNYDRILEFEEKSGVDIFNYYKCMQKNKDFLMLGRFFSEEETLPNGCHKTYLLSKGNNQLCLYKQSNMNSTMQRNICKLILQEGMNQIYFPRSLQSLSEKMLHTKDVLELMKDKPTIIKLDDVEAIAYSDGHRMEMIVPALNQTISKRYWPKILAEPFDETSTDGDIEKYSDYDLVSNLFAMTNQSQQVLSKYRTPGNISRNDEYHWMLTTYVTPKEPTMAQSSFSQK